jgi:NADPH2:quinone reductase
VKAWLLDEIGRGLSGLRLGEIPDPTPGEGEALVRVHLAGLNPADRYLSEGQYPAKPALPHILGRDGIGVIERLGPGTDASGFKVGDKVTIVRSEVGVSRRGTFAQRVAVPVESLVHPPKGWSDEEAGGPTLVYLTAYQAITQWMGDATPLPKEALVLVTGASGGVGVASVQLAKAMGHTVIGLSRDPEKSRRVRELGAVATFDPNDPDWVKKLKQQFSPRRVYLAIDNVGGPLFSQVIETLGDRGRVSVVGRLAGPVPNFNTSTLIFRRLRIGGVAVGAYTPAESRAAWDAIVALLARTNARPIVDSVFPFEKLPDAFERLHQGPMGKVLLRVAPT